MAAMGYLKIVALFYMFCFTGNTFTGYFDGIGWVLVNLFWSGCLTGLRQEVCRRDKR